MNDLYIYDALLPDNEWIFPIDNYTKMPQKKVILIFMDGWGLGKVASADAIQHADVPLPGHFIQSIQTPSL